MSACVCACVSVCVCVCLCTNNSKNNGSIHLKLEHTGTVVYGNSLHDFDIQHCPIKLKVMV